VLRTFDFTCVNGLCGWKGERVIRGEDNVLCEDCGGLTNRLFPAPNLYGMQKFSWKYNHALGFKPSSSRQVDKFLESKGYGYAGTKESSNGGALSSAEKRKAEEAQKHKDYTKINKVLNKLGPMSWEKE